MPWSLLLDFWRILYTVTSLTCQKRSEALEIMKLGREKYTPFQQCTKIDVFLKGKLKFFLWREKPTPFQECTKISVFFFLMMSSFIPLLGVDKHICSARHRYRPNVPNVPRRISLGVCVLFQHHIIFTIFNILFLPYYFYHIIFTIFTILCHREGAQPIQASLPWQTICYQPCLEHPKS